MSDEPVAYASPGWASGNGRCIHHLGQRSILEERENMQFTPLYAHPDPRAAEALAIVMGYPGIREYLGSQISNIADAALEKT